MLATLSPLFGAGLVVLACTALGTILLRRLDLALSRAESRLFAFLTGAACLSLLVLALAALQLVYSGVFCVLTAILLWCAWGRKRETHFETVAPGRWTPIALALTVALPFFVLYFVTAWAPEYSPDGSSYHLGNVLQFARHHGLIPIRDLYGAFPEGIEMLFLFAFTIGKHSAAALVHFSFLVALPFLMYRYSVRFGFPRAGIVAALMVFVSPLFGKDGISAYNDVALATVAFGVFYLLELWLEKKDDHFLIPAGILAGFAFGIKYTGFVAALYAAVPLAMGLWRERRLHWREIWRPILLFSVACLALVAPWLIKDAIYMHNPVAPFLNHLFPNPWISPRFETDYAQGMAGFAGAKSLCELVFDYTVTGSKVQGLFGPLFVLSPLSLVSLRTRHGRHLLLAALLFGLPVLSNQGSRFLMAAVPPLAIAMALAIAETKFAAPALIILQGLSCWPGIVSLYSDPYVWRLDAQIPIEAAWHRRRADAYLRHWIGPAYDMAKIINAKTPPGSRIFCFNCPPQAYMERESLVGYQSTLGNALEDMLYAPNQPGRQTRKRITLTFPRALVSRLRVSAPRLRPDEVWRVNELRVRNGETEVPRSPAWRIDAWPDPWEAPFAFDNNPASRWSAERPGAAGAFLETDFDRPTALDSVQIECDGGATEQLIVLADTGSGMMAPLNAATDAAEVAPPSGLRRAAILMLKRYGFQYLVVREGDYFVGDFSLRAGSWGIRPVAQTGGITLFHLE